MFKVHCNTDEAIWNCMLNLGFAYPQIEEIGHSYLSLKNVTKKRKV